MSTEPKIVLMDANNEQPLRKWRATQTKEFGLPVTANLLVEGVKYKIVSVGNTDFTAVGAADNNVGTVFVATGAGEGTGTAVQMITRYNVKSGEESDVLNFMVWNNRKCNEVIDLEIKSGSTTSGDIVIKLDGIDYIVTVDENTDTDVIGAAIIDGMRAHVDFNNAWEATLIPAIEFDGVKVANTIVTFVAKDTEPKGDYLFNAGQTGIDGIIKRMLEGNPATEPVSKITDARIYIRDDQGGISSDVVKNKWAWIKNETDATYTNIGVDINKDTGVTTEYDLKLKAVNSAVALGEILGDVNTGSLADDKNYDKLSLFMKPPVTGVAQGLRQWKLVITYNFT